MGRVDRWLVTPTRTGCVSGCVVGRPMNPWWGPIDVLDPGSFRPRLVVHAPGFGASDGPGSAYVPLWAASSRAAVVGMCVRGVPQAGVAPDGAGWVYLGPEASLSLTLSDQPLPFTVYEGIVVDMTDELRATLSDPGVIAALREAHRAYQGGELLRGDGVRRLQEALNGRGFKLEVDGVLGAETGAAASTLPISSPAWSQRSWTAQPRSEIPRSHLLMGFGGRY